ncbi:MAG: hypothetical protein ACFFD4_19665 [Candidatus Odinarchaeota archaeon]
MSGSRQKKSKNTKFTFDFDNLEIHGEVDDAIEYLELIEAIISVQKKKIIFFRSSGLTKPPKKTKKTDGGDGSNTPSCSADLIEEDS